MKDRIALPARLIPKFRNSEKVELLLVFVHGRTRKQIMAKAAIVKKLCRRMFMDYVRSQRNIHVPKT